MTKKDFIALADSLRPLYERGELSEQVVSALCAFCSSQNGRFNSGLWRDYLAGKCGPNGGPIPDKTTQDRRTSK